MPGTSLWDRLIQNERTIQADQFPFCCFVDAQSWLSSWVADMIHGWCREGYTIGYYGRIFKAKNGVKGGAFDAETEFERFVVGAGTIVPGLEQGILSMRVGGIRQIVIPAEIGYPLDDPPHDKVGPKPPNFDGQRALNFVLYNQGLIDKTLLFNVKLIRIDTPNGKGGFTRGVVQASSAGKASPKPVEEDEDEE